MELTNGHWGVETVWNAVHETPKLALSFDVQQAIQRCREYLETKLGGLSI